MRRLTLVKVAGLGLLVLGLVLAGFLIDLEQVLDRDGLRRRVRHDLWAGLLFFFVVATLIKLLFVPAAPLSVAAGYLFGGLLGSVISVISLTVSSLISFAAGRLLGRDAVRALLEDSYQALQRYDERIRRHGFLTTLFLRIVPTLPVAAVNLGLGVTAVRWRDFLLATLVGFLPGVILLANVGERITDLRDPWLWVLAGLLLAMVAAALFVAHRMRRR